MGREVVSGKFDGLAVHGVRLHALDGSYDPTLTAVAMLAVTRRQSGQEWQWHESHFDRLAGTGALRRGLDEGESLEQLTDGWDQALEAFRSRRSPYLLYPD